MPACAQWGSAGGVAASRHSVLERTQAAELGLSPKVIRRLKMAGHLIEPVPGVLVVAGSPETWQRQLTIATLGSSSAGVAGFRTAAALHRCDGYPFGPVELVVPSWLRSPTAVLADVLAVIERRSRDLGIMDSSRRL